MAPSGKKGKKKMIEEEEIMVTPTHEEAKKDEKQKDKKEEKKEEEMVSFFAMFRYATKMDVLLMLLGSVGAILNGAGISFFILSSFFIFLPF